MTSTVASTNAKGAVHSREEVPAPVSCGQETGQLYHEDPDMITVFRKLPQGVPAFYVRGTHHGFLILSFGLPAAERAKIRQESSGFFADDKKLAHLWR